MNKPDSNPEAVAAMTQALKDCRTEMCFLRSVIVSGETLTANDNREFWERLERADALLSEHSTVAGALPVTPKPANAVLSPTGVAAPKSIQDEAIEICNEFALPEIQFVPPAVRPEETDEEKLVAAWLEKFARAVDAESVVPMIPKSRTSWEGFIADARCLLTALRKARAVEPEDTKIVDWLERQCFTNREGEREIHFDFKGTFRDAARAAMSDTKADSGG